MPSRGATPSSTIACASEPLPARPRTSASLSARDEAGGREQVDDELGHRVDAHARAERRRRRTCRVAGGAGRARFGGRSIRHIPRSSYRQAEGSLTARSGAIERRPMTGAQVRVQQRVAAEQGDDAAEREERRERDPHLPRRAAVAGEEHDRRHERREHPDHQRDRHGSPEHRTEQQRELDVAHAHPLRVGERGQEQEERGAEARRAPTPRSGASRSARRARSRPRAARPVRDDPVLEVGGRDRDERGAEERRRRTPCPTQPKARKQAATRSASASSTAGRRTPIALVAAPAAAAEQRARRRRDVVVPRELVAAAHAGRAGRTIDRFRGTRAATTLRKLPTARPGMNATAERAKSI